MKKGIIIGLVVITLGAVAYFLWFRKSDRSSSVSWETVKIDRGNIRNEVTATGTLQAVTEVEVGTQVSGKINEIFVDFNSKVRKGDVIARLDTTTLAAQVFDAKASVQRMRIQLRQAERNYKRTSELYKQKVMARIDYEKALDAYEMAQANLYSAEAQLNRLKTNLGYATITSPIDGIVISRNVEVGQTVAASFNSPTLFQIVNDLTKMQVEANVDEADIGQVKVGQEVSFTVDAYPDDNFNGKVRQIRLQPVVISNVVNYIVIIDVPNPEMKLMPGMTASLSIYVNKADSVLRVPVKALTFHPPESYLEHYNENLPDSVKKKQDERMQRIRQRMKSMGMSDAQIDQRIKQFQEMRKKGGQSGAFMNGGGATAGGKQASRKVPIGNIWVLENNTLRPVRVRTGLSDGRYTEISGREVKEGMEVVTGYSMSSDKKQSSSEMQRSPFLPKFGRGRR
ncbi:MAG TPA: efflux RND transporter periplasmic adaptor subunit [Bacteroidetes bacterium]|nr:efflux RND transporter periplasmic adaptor subunit [Bacteroidota bacterium]